MNSTSTRGQIFTVNKDARHLRVVSKRPLGSAPLPKYWSVTSHVRSLMPVFYNACMSGSPAVYSSESMRAEKRAVAGSSVLAAVTITTLKIVVGVTTGSLGILSEALHSGLDLVAAIITLMSVRVSDKPADADHQYGHGKVENFSAFIETGLLLLTCIWIIYEAVMRLFFQSVEIEPSVAAFLVMLLSIVVDAWRSRSLGRIAM